MDISACNDISCNLKDKCLRYTMIKDNLQWYSDFKQIDNKCDYFIDNK